MRAISLVAPGRVELVELAEPEPGPEDLLVEVAYVGLCGSDLNAYRGRSALVSYPRILGHEVAGVVAAVGAKAGTRFREGARVTLSPYSHCGGCPACRAGRTNACERNQTLGVQRDGALAERIAIHHSRVHASETLSLQALALVEPLSVGCHAVGRARVCDTDSVLVLGCGAVGLGAVAAAARRGARVIALDIEPAKLGLAANLGAHDVVDASAQDARARVQELTSGEGVNVAIEAAGAAATYQLALSAVCTGGRLIAVGYAKDPLLLDTSLVVRKELDWLGSRNALDEFPDVIHMVEECERPFLSLISRIVPLRETGEALDHWASAPQEITRILVAVSAPGGGRL